MENHPSSASPAKTSYKGCFIAIAILVVLGIAGAIMTYGLFAFKKTETVFEKEHSMVPGLFDEGVVIELSKLDSYSPEDFGTTLTAEHFIAITASDKTTSLAQKRFTEKANGFRVEWMLNVADITISDDESGAVSAEFSLPYQFRSGTRSQGSTLSIRAEFSAESASRLVVLRKGNWVKVAGNLNFMPGGKNIVFESAELVEK